MCGGIYKVRNQNVLDKLRKTKSMENHTKVQAYVETNRISGGVGGNLEYAYMKEECVKNTHSTVEAGGTIQY